MSKESRKARRRQLFAMGVLPKAPIEKPRPVITLVWKDGDETDATIERFAPEVTCGKARFRRKEEGSTIYIEV